MPSKKEKQEQPKKELKKKQPAMPKNPDEEVKKLPKKAGLDQTKPKTKKKQKKSIEPQKKIEKGETTKER